MLHRVDRLRRLATRCRLRLGLPAGLLRQPLGLRLQRLPGDGLPGEEAHGVPGQPGPGADRGGRADGRRSPSSRCRRRTTTPAHTGNETISELIKLEGAKVVYQEANIPASSAGVSFTPFVQAIKAANPNILLTLVDFQTAPGLTAAMTAGGYTGANVNYVGLHPGPARHVGAARGGLQRRLREQPDGAVRRHRHALHQADAEGPDREQRQDRQASSPWPTRSRTRRPTCWSRS